MTSDEENGELGIVGSVIVSLPSLLVRSPKPKVATEPLTGIGNVKVNDCPFAGSVEVI